MSRNYYRSREEDAVSPVIATILMVAITVVLAGTLYVWAASLAESNTDGSLSLYTFEARESPSSPTANADDGLAILTMTRGEDTSWSVLSVQLSVNGAASVACGVPGQTDGSCVVVDTSNDVGSWTTGEDVTVFENGVDLCSDETCEMTFSISNLRTGQTLGKTSTGSVTTPGDYSPPTTPNPGQGDDDSGNDNQDGGDNNDNGDDNTNTEQCSSSSECMQGGYCLNGVCVYDDQDIDGISDAQDNCPQNANADQADADQDGTGDACDATPYGPMTTYYADADGDTYGDANQPTDAYTQPAGYVTNSDDCNDQDANLNLLNSLGNCAPEPATNTYYRDADGDTYGDITQTTQATSQPAGYVTNSDDCDDTDSTLNLLNSNGDCAPEPQPSVVEAMTQTSVVNSVMQNGHKYVFNDGTIYDENTQYGLGDGTYTFSNIGITHPMAILNAGKAAEISYTSSNDPIVIKVSGGTFSAPYYDFTDADGNVIDIYNGNFGFMRGQTYVFEADGISSSHPFRVYSDGSYSQSISGASSSITVSIPTDHSTTAGDLFYDCAVHTAMKGNMQILNAAIDGTNYDFYYGDITVTVTGDFGVVSVYCLYHGYMGGQDILVYGSEYEIVDTTPPVITVLGNNPETVEVGSTYTDAGATADGGETVTTSGTVDTNTVGVYTITYTATDSSNNQATATRTVYVVDTNAPVITVIGDNPATVELGSTYTDAGATADGGETVTTSGTVDTNTVGVYTITYTATDSSGNQGIATRTVNVVDTTAPVITVLGNDPETVEVGSTYTDAGATADGGETVTTSGTVDTNTVGVYTITYTATDSSNNVATATRTVNVVDTTAPVITLIGSNPIDVEAATTYTDAGATAQDNYDGDITSSITTTNNIDMNTVGTYSVIYNVADANGNSAVPLIRTVNVVDTTAPVITILGSNPVNIQVGSVYNDAGATAADTLDGDLSSSITVVNNVDANTVGTYTVTYDVTDSAGNQATQAVRTVNVNSAPNTAPTVDSVSLSTSSNDGLVYSDVTLTCTPTTSDADGDTVTTSITWTADGNQIGTGSSITLTTSLVNIGDAVFCTVTPNDGTVDGTPVDSTSATVQNYAPTISSVTIDNTSPTIGDTLTCSATASDPEGHSLTTTYTWYVNSVEQSPTSPTFDTTGLSDNDVVYCSARVVDAYGAPAVLQSSSVTVTAGSSPTTHYIDIENMAYSPASITINVGDTIVWENKDSGPHTVTANDGSFDSGYMGSGATFSFTFTSAGTFDYYCAYHSMMTGTVIVQ